MSKYMKLLSILCCLLGFSLIVQTVKAQSMICPRSAQYLCYKADVHHNFFLVGRASVPTVFSHRYNICIPGQYDASRSSACAWAFQACNSQLPMCNGRCVAGTGIGNVIRCSNVFPGRPIVNGPVNGMPFSTIMGGY